MHPPHGLRLATDPAALATLPVIVDPDPAATLLTPLSMILTTPTVAQGMSIASPMTLGSIPIPAKLCKRILNPEFVEMSELRPEAWGSEDSQSCCPGSQQLTRRAPVQDILLWTECFSWWQYSDRPTPTTLPTSWHTNGLLSGLAEYLKAMHGSCMIGITGDGLHSLRISSGQSSTLPCTTGRAFTGRARIIPRCSHCLSEIHSVANCPDLPQGPLPTPQQTSIRPAKWLSSTSVQRGSLTVPATPAVSSEYCCLFNQIQCRSRCCRYTHLCSTCSLPHPAKVCPSRGKQDWSPPLASQPQEPDHHPPMA